MACGKGSITLPCKFCCTSRDQYARTSRFWSPTFLDTSGKLPPMPPYTSPCCGTQCPESQRRPFWWFWQNFVALHNDNFHMENCHLLWDHGRNTRYCSAIFRGSLNHCLLLWWGYHWSSCNHCIVLMSGFLVQLDGIFRPLMKMLWQLPTKILAFSTVASTIWQWPEHASSCTSPVILIMQCWGQPLCGYLPMTHNSQTKIPLICHTPSKASTSISVSIIHSDW